MAAAANTNLTAAIKTINISLRQEPEQKVSRTTQIKLEFRIIAAKVQKAIFSPLLD